MQNNKHDKARFDDAWKHVFNVEGKHYESTHENCSNEEQENIFTEYLHELDWKALLSYSHRRGA